jgi:DNA-binding beta-propeller fold protein YncE
MSPSLTTSAASRAYDYNRVVGGRQQMNGIVSMAFGEDDSVYITQKALFFFDVSKLKIGSEIDDEEFVLSFREIDSSHFEDAWPSCVAVGPGHDVYVTDELRNLVSVFDSDGNFIRNFGESGADPGQFDRPSGIIFGADGTMYVSDTMNHRIQHLAPDGKVINVWGSEGSDEGQFRSPWGVNVGGDGNVWVADHRNHRVQKFDADGNFISALGTYGSEAGKFDHPTDVAIDPDGDIYVCDWANHRVQVFNEEGEYLLQIGGSAVELSKWQKRFVEASPDMVKARRRVNTLEPETKFALPTSVRFDAKRNRLYVVDSQRWRIQIFDKIKDYAEPQFNI